jgi:cell wall-associated NlpC family hydrolase
MFRLITLLSIVLLLAISSKSHGLMPKTETQDRTDALGTIDRGKILAFAESLLGAPYRYGSSDPKKGFDCSGFVSFVFKNFNIELPRSSSEFKKMGKDVKPKNFKPGDVLVFYSFRSKTRIGHVGIVYEADGMKSKFIHSSSGKTKGVIISDLGSKTYSKRFYRCVDVLEGK